MISVSSFVFESQRGISRIAAGSQTAILTEKDVMRRQKNVNSLTERGQRTKIVHERPCKIPFKLNTLTERV
jgi:hypothetical protein